MTLLELVKTVKEISLKHKDIKTFKLGSEFDVAAYGSEEYPQVFMELPFMINYDLLDEYRDNVQFALNIFVNINADDIHNDIFGISIAKEIGDSIINYINLFVDDFKIAEANSISLREFGDDSVAGIRYDLTIILPRTCIDDYHDYFNLD